MMRDGLLVFRDTEGLTPMLPTVVAASGIPIKTKSARVIPNGIELETTPSIGSWWGETLSIQLRPQEGGASVVVFRSDHHGPSFLKDTDNVARMKRSFKRTMKTLGVTVSLVRPVLGPEL